MSPFRAAMIIAAGFGMVVLTVVNISRGLSTVGYRQTSGIVVASNVESTVTGRISLHEPKIQYRYKVDGKTYESRQYTVVWMDEAGTLEWAESIVGTLMPGADCAVYYSPHAPENSVLRRAPRFGTCLFAATMLTVGLACGIGGIFSLRK